MFKKFLSRIGIGSAKIDLVLDRDVVVMGETVNGKIFVKGGEVEQQIGEISVDLKVKSSYKKGDHTLGVNERVASYKAVDGFVIGSGEEKEFEISFEIPELIPVSSINTKYHLLTNLDISEALDSKDYDYITVLPSGLLKNFLEGFKELGFMPKYESYTGQYQIIDFHPTTWLAGKLDELVFSFQPSRTQQEISGHFEVDKRGGGIGGWLADELDLDERKGHYRFSAADLATVDKAKDTIRAFIEKHYKSLA